LSVSGKFSPLMLKPGPEAVAAEIIRLVPPELVSVSERDFVPATATLPKLRLAGFAVSWPGATPTPESGTVSVGLFASEEMVRLPLAFPADAGVKMALNVADCPAVKVTGSLGPLNVNPLPVAAAFEIVTVDPPVLVTVTARLLLLPTVTLPKATLLGFAVNEPGATPVPDKAMFSGEPGASETIARFPFALPDAVGENFALNANV
jgi:hypothetical protein